ncbi:MAG: efflux RND transporter periplasmic adaptor subunit [Sandaracinus sp.]|nr:efflux RND transporter periplasmic adaptor subunit [Sandaracinus sp.]MCB9631807.1 efflux RND transporter periplasmic adaptor subunit [Sandaracinus sp.]
MSAGSKKKRLGIVLGLIVLGGGGVWWWTSRSKAGTENAAAREVRAVERGELVETAEATGKIEPHVQVEVKSRTSGEVIEVLVAEGDQVEAGQLLFRLDPRDAERSLEDARVALRRVQAELSQARANLAVTEAQARDADATRDVSARGAERGLVSNEASRTAASSAEVARANVQLRQAAISASQASLAAARLAVADAEQRLSEISIYAPVAGTVLDVAVERGSIVASALTNVNGGTALATVADLTDLRVIGAIDEAQISRVHVGQDVRIRVDAYPERTFEGRVERVAPLGVTATNVVTFDVEIVVTDAEASLLRSGMSADLSIITGRSEGVLVPLAAVRSNEGRRYVVLASGEERTIRTGGNDGRNLVVVDGLVEGDRIVVSGAVARASGGSNNGLFGPPRRGGSSSGSRRSGGGGPPGGPP